MRVCGQEPSAAVGYGALALVGVAAITAIAIAALRRSKGFDVTSYNVMADVHSNPAFTDWYDHVDASLMNWDLRQEALLGHLPSSDVLCLQEVEPQFFEVLRERLEGRGYQGLYQQKLDHGEGLALFFKADSCTLVEESTLFYEVSGPSAGAWRPAQIVKFNIDGKEVGIVNTHLAWDVEGSLAGAELSQLAERLKSDEFTQWIICGDFNIEPDCPALEHLKKMGMHYAYEGMEQPTVCVKPFGDTFYREKVDYIWATDGLKSAAHKIENITHSQGLPSLTQPSDHVAITATFN